MLLFYLFVCFISLNEVIKYLNFGLEVEIEKGIKLNYFISLEVYV